MIKAIVEAVKKVPKAEIEQNLDAYEREAIRETSRWAKTAPIPEIMVILTKINIPAYILLMDDRDPLQAYELHKASRELYRTGKFDKLAELARKHTYFSLTGSQIMKEQDLYSLLVGGTVFKVNPDSKLFLKSALNKDSRNQKAADEVIANIYEKSEIGELSFTDWKILYLVRRYDYTPVGTKLIHDRLSYTLDPNVIQRHLARLTKMKYLEKYGVKKMSMYTLTAKGWKAISDKKKEFFAGVRFFDNNSSTEINQSNGSSQITRPEPI